MYMVANSVSLACDHPFFDPSPQIPDYLSLDKLASSVGSILIVGGGFLGSELAVGLASRGELGQGNAGYDPSISLPCTVSFPSTVYSHREGEGAAGHTDVPRGR